MARLRFHLLRSVAFLLTALPLALLGCGWASRSDGETPPAGFSADTFTREGLISGATATESGCRAQADAIWVDISGRRECLRYAAGGAERPARTAIVHFPGDPTGVSYRFAGGRVQVELVSDFYEHTAGSRRLAAQTLAGAMRGVPVFLMGRPGMHGSSGDHGQDRHTQAEILLIDAALTELKRRHGLQDFALSGFSSGGLVVANLLARRDDIRCAVIASAPLDLARFHLRQDAAVPDHFALRDGDLADPIRAVRSIRSNAAIFVIGDTRDRNVPPSAWSNWVEAAQRQGLRVHHAVITGHDRPELGGRDSYHITGVRGLEVAHACAMGAPGEPLRQALLTEAPILRPQGRPLGGAEIGPAFAGRRLAGITWPHWGTRAIVFTHWDRSGERYQFHPAHPERRIATHRWWLDGDRLCTSDNGCNAVLAEQGFLHVVEGDPPRHSVTYVESLADE